MWLLDSGSDLELARTLLPMRLSSPKDPEVELRFSTRIELPGAATMSAAVRTSSAERVQGAAASEDWRFLRLLLCMLPCLRRDINSFAVSSGVAASGYSCAIPSVFDIADVRTSDEGERIRLLALDT